MPEVSTQHHTTGDTLPNKDRPGGTWTASCTCGWEKTGRYARTNVMAEYTALRLAHAYGAQHEEDPDAAEETDGGS